MTLPLIFGRFHEGGCKGVPIPFEYYITLSNGDHPHSGEFLAHWDDTWHKTLQAAQAHAQADYKKRQEAKL